MNYVIKTAKTVDEAVREALTELNITRENAEIEVLDEGQKGFLGLIGSKDATVNPSTHSVHNSGTVGKSNSAA